MEYCNQNPMKTIKLIYLIPAICLLSAHSASAGGCHYFGHTYSRQPDVSCCCISCVDTFYLSMGDSFKFNLFWYGDALCPTSAIFYQNGIPIPAGPASLTVTSGGHYKGEVGYMSSLHWEFYVVYSSTTGMNNHKLPDHVIKVYPNPVAEEVSIELNSANSKVEKIKIFNSLSQLLFEGMMPETNHLVIKTENWNAGIYIIRIYSSENEFTAKRFVKASL